MQTISAFWCTLIALLCIAQQQLYVVATFSNNSNSSTSSTVDNNFNSNNDEIEKLKAKYLPAEYAKSNYTLNDVKRMLRQKCKHANNGVDTPEIYENIEKAATDLMQCANSVLNLTALYADIEEARPEGNLDVVFQKYCLHRPRAQQCLRDFNKQLQPCLTTEERAQNDVLMRILTSLLEFICYRNGDLVAIFIAEDGPECIESHKEDIANCMNSTFSAYLPKVENATINTLANMQEIPELVFGPNHCIEFYDFEACVLSYLEQCNEITPSNVIESIFRYVRNETKCQKEIEKILAIKSLDMRNNGNSFAVKISLLLPLALIVFIFPLTSVLRRCYGNAVQCSIG